MYGWKLPVLLGLVLGGWGCAQPPAASRELRPQPNANARAAPAEKVITLQRKDGGWGMSPVYDLTIYADGGVVFEGKKNVKTTGTASGSVGRQEVERLISEFEKADYFSLADRYMDKENCPVPSADTPIIVTSLTHNGRSKTVVHDTGCKGVPALEKLSALEKLIEEVAGTRRWIK